MKIKVKDTNMKSKNEEFYKGDDRGFLVLVQNMIEGNWYNTARKAFKGLTFDCYEMDGDGDDMKICFEAYGDEIDEPLSDELAEIVEQAATDGCEEANKSTDPTIADYDLDADFIIWDEPELFHNQWSYVVNLSSKPKNSKSESADESVPKEVKPPPSTAAENTPP